MTTSPANATHQADPDGPQANASPQVGGGPQAGTRSRADAEPQAATAEPKGPGDLPLAPRVTAVLLAYGPEPWLADAVRAVSASAGLDLEVIVVDNGCTGDGVQVIAGWPGVRVLRPAMNTGYAGGCRLGAAEATGDHLVFVNSDAIVEPDALARLVAVAGENGVGAATASIRLADRPDLINSAGNPVHFTGLSWAGGHGQPASRYPDRRATAALSGCCFAIRRELWRRLDGFAVEYFAYHEDTELSLRLWQAGLRVEYVPDAVVRHRYEFSRNDLKTYLLERNRLITLLTAYESRTLVVLGPALLATEAAILAGAVAGGWAGPKLRGWRWLWRHRGWLLARRRRLQAERRVPDGVVARMMTARIDPGNVAAPAGVGLFNAAAQTYWRLARRLLRTE
ncbi:glycosyltransferase family 2 protein [Solwaraspora sp. WMMD1047]|uniref:glycosyltransferase family 2 protein n=1 Tax=Solwaraspora sp. WMMD1047 TaxID=3016102 RepID=UPI002415CD9D|nr:glycosyltransferase family 2 protein [Solwaraspora sp. WMMD1047]MDG4831145.1 glycosyltransferase family 2 protein [Solwaraspora sp. WMMD1047]